MGKTKKFKKPSKEKMTIDCIKTAKKHSREIELQNLSGFTSNHKVFKSKKAYSRKRKHANIWEG